jgi:hypothetical protein
LIAKCGPKIEPKIGQKRHAMQSLSPKIRRLTRGCRPAGTLGSLQVVVGMGDAGLPADWADQGQFQQAQAATGNLPPETGNLESASEALRHVSHHVTHDGHRRHGSGQIARFDLVDRVGLGVVDREVERTLDIE